MLGRLETLYHEPVAGAEHVIEPAVFALHDRLQGNPDGVDAVRVVDPDRAGDGVLTARDDERVVDRERQRRRPGALALAETGGPEQETQRP